MKFLFVTIFGESAALAKHLMDEGHGVRFYIQNPDYASVGRGIIPKARKWRDFLSWADVIVFDDVELAAETESLRKRGYAVVGGNTFGDRLENDRIFGQRIMREAGIKTPQSWRFRSFESAIRFIKKNPKKYVVKYNGQLDRHLCYVGRFPDGEDLAHILGYHQNKWPKERKIDFILQEVIDGIEMSVGAFFNGRDFAYPINLTFEHKHLMPGGIGPFTGEMGTSMFYSRDGGRLFRETLLKIKPYLAQTNYRGFIDINNIINNTGAYAIEFTARFGYPQLDIQIELHKTPWGELLEKLAKGSLVSFEVHAGFAVGVIVGGAGMPFDVSYNRYGRNLPILGINPANERHVRLAQVYKQAGKLYTAAGGYPLTITGRGKTMRAAQKNAYKIVEQIVIPNGVYRNDIGDHWGHEAPLLKKWGYI